MRVLMFGWEMPPFISGGLGTACYGFTKALAKKKVEVVFVVPHWPDEQTHPFMRMVSANFDLAKIYALDSLAVPYDSSATYSERFYQYMKNRGAINPNALYGANLAEEVQRMAIAARTIAKMEQFDIIHCHDWMTFLAGIEAKRVSGKPLIIHVHTIEFDRTGGNGENPWVKDIERQALAHADRVIANSNYTKQNIVKHYNTDPARIDVVLNAVEPEFAQPRFVVKPNDKIVLFLARMTLQKGPEYFLYAAKRVLEKNKKVRFIMAGGGDMLARMINLAIELGINEHVYFTGAVRGEDVKRLYKMADVYVLPSVSEPFGISVLEAMASGTPTIVSKQCGLSEVLGHVLKTDFWDVNDLADKMLALLEYAPLHEEIRHHGHHQAMTFTWEKSADDLIHVYQQVSVNG